MPATLGTRALEIFPIAIGAYDHHEQLDVDVEVQRVVDLLSEFGASENPWPVAMPDRGADAVDARLHAWSRPSRPMDSLLYWIGHGWSDGFDVALAHARSPVSVRTSGLLPVHLAEPVRARQSAANGTWSIVVVDACWSAAFVDKINAQLAAGPVGADAVLLVGTSSSGATSLGRFTAVLHACLRENFRADVTIPLWQLAGELDRRLSHGLVVARRLGDAALIRRSAPVAGVFPGSLDVVMDLELALARLSDDERRHFLVKAQGAEEGELAWFFQGRDHELAQIVDWLNTADSGLLTVTGRAGSGKSALLGHVLVHSLPDLREALVRARLTEALPATTRPPDGVFNEVVHLAGLGLSTVVTRIADAAGLGQPPSIADPNAGYGTANDLDWLVRGLRQRGKPFTVLVDALDEAADPLIIARAFLRRIADVPGIRVVVGTRRSTRESPDHPEPDDANLLAGLSALDRRGSDRVIWVTRDDAAVVRYVTQRLMLARDRGTIAIGDQAVTDSAIHRVAAVVGQCQREFLFARLAVYELIADPVLLDPARSRSLARLLAADHRDLFTVAVARLARQSDNFLPLLEALALTRGRGVPILDGIWALMATALAEGTPMDTPISDADISALLGVAQPYVSVDTEVGQTVYRFAHRTFAEHFLARWEQTPRGGTTLLAERERQVSRALMEAVERKTQDTTNPYLARYLSGHVANADAWEDLAGRPGALDRLDPNAVTADALRTIMGRGHIAPSIAGVLGARHDLANSATRDRAGLRQLAMTRYSLQRVPDEALTAAMPWGVAAAAVDQVALHVLLSGHNGYVNCLCTVSSPDHGTLVASGGDDGTVRIWSPETAAPVGPPLLGHAGPVLDLCDVPVQAGLGLLASCGADGTVRLWNAALTAAYAAPLIGHVGPVVSVCAVPVPDGRTLLASAGADGTVRLWDPEAAAPFQGPLTGHAGPVRGVCSVPVAGGGSVLVSAGADGTIRMWDAVTGTAAGAPLTGHTGPVRGVYRVTAYDGRTILASAGADGTIRLWNAEAAAPVGVPLTGHTGPVRGVCSLATADGQVLLAAASGDGTVRLWDLTTAEPVGAPPIGHPGEVWDVCAVPMSDGRVLLATAGGDGTLRLWDPATAAALGAPQIAHPGTVWGVCAVTDSRGQVRVASAGSDGTVRLWDPITATLSGTPLTGHTGLVRGVTPVSWPDGRVLLASAGTDDTLRLWDPVAAVAVGSPIRGHAGGLWCACPVYLPDERVLLAAAGLNGTVQLWDPLTGSPAGAPLTGHTGAVRAVGTVAMPDGGVLLASAGDDGTVRLWDPLTGSPAGAPLTGHTGAVRAVGTVAMPDGGVLLASAGDDGTVRLWDPLTGSPAGAPLTGHMGRVGWVCAVPAPDGRVWLASAGGDGTVRLRDPSVAGATGHVITGHTGTVWGVCAVPLPDGSVLVASAGADGTVRLWNPVSATAVGPPLGGDPGSVETVDYHRAADGHTRAVLAGPSPDLQIWEPATATVTSRLPGIAGAVTAVCVTPGADGSPAVAVGGNDGIIRWLNLSTGETLGPPIQATVGPVLAMCALPGDPPSIAVAGSDGGITRWKLGSTLRVGDRLAGHRGPVRTLALLAMHGGHSLLLSGGQDGMVRRWEVEGWRAFGRPLIGHAGWVWSVCGIDGAVNSSHALASAGVDRTIRRWAAVTGAPIGRPLTGHTDQVRALCRLQDTNGRAILASGGLDRTVRLWSPETGRPIMSIPLGLPIHALSQAPRAQHERREHTPRAADLTVGTRNGVVVIALHDSVFRDL